MLRWPALCALGVAALAGAQPGHTVNQTIEQVRAALRESWNDSRIARTLGKWKLSESLDQHTIEELESEGAGPQTVTELERLRQASGTLPEPAGPPLFPSPAPPAPEEQNRILREARQTALHYSDSLPDFVATEAVRRYSDDRGAWHLKDTIVVKLTYFERQEDYQVVSINGRPSAASYYELGGTITQGEFGSLLRQVFEPRSAAELHWDHWTNLRGRPAHVFTFRVLPANSRYTMTAGTRSDRYAASSSVTVGQHGVVYVDRDTLQIVRILAETDSIPSDFPVRSTSTRLDYDFVDVGGRRFLLPLRAEVRMGTRSIETRNEVQFQSYRKFGADTSITFEGPVKP